MPDFKEKLPNILTVARIILIPIFIMLFCLPNRWSHLLAALVFVAASVTDYLDGNIARKYNVQSNFGRCLDPIADKLLVVAALIMLVYSSNRDILITLSSIIIISREILVSGLREFLSGMHVSVPVTYLSKVKTTVQMIAIGLLVFGTSGLSLILDMLFIPPEIYSYISWLAVTVFGKFMLLISAVLTIVTGYSHWKLGMKNM